MDLVLLVDCPLDQRTVSVVQYAEMLGFVVVWNDESLEPEVFADTFVEDTRWSRYFFVEPGPRITDSLRDKAMLVSLEQLCHTVAPGKTLEPPLSSRIGSQPETTGSRPKALVIYSAPVLHVKHVLSLLREASGEIEIHLLGRENAELLNSSDRFLRYGHDGPYLWHKLSCEIQRELRNSEYSLAVVPLNNYDGSGYDNIISILRNIGISDYFAVNPVFAVERKRTAADVSTNEPEP
jgi:hypothetical protein